MFARSINLRLQLRIVVVLCLVAVVIVVLANMQLRGIIDECAGERVNCIGRTLDLDFDIGGEFGAAKDAALGAMQSWEFGLEQLADETEPEEPVGVARTVVRPSATAGSSFWPVANDRMGAASVPD